jgi:RNA polymerase sigma factor (sigma-70 family)
MITDQAKQAAQTISDEKLTEIYNLKKDVMLAYAFSDTKDYHRAEEVVQEAFLMLRKEDYSRFKDDNHIGAWLMLVCKRLILCLYRRNTRPIDSLVIETIKDPRSNPRDHLINEDNLNELRSVYKRIKPNYLRALHLFYFNEMKLHDIAKEMGTTQKMVSFMISKGRKILRGFLTTN